MKKIAAIALVACIAMVVMAAVPALADRAKPVLKPYTPNFGGTQKCGGFVIFSDSKTKPLANNLHVTVSLKKADLSNTSPDISDDTTFDVWFWCSTDGGVTWSYTPAIDTLTINAAGNGNCHFDTAVPSGTNLLYVELCPESYPTWTAFYTDKVSLTFK